MNRRKALKAIGAGAAGAYLSSRERLLGQQWSPTKAPNILVVMTDDQRHDALSLAGNQILKTPNMDRIGLEGVRFSNAFVTNALCAPSRASILTGVYSHEHGVISNGDGPLFRNQPGLAGNQITFVELLRRAGYHTAIVGKWHLRSDPTGFDHWAILPGQGAYYDPEMIADGVHVKMRGHVDDVVGDQALTYLARRPREKPFCLLFHFKSPHRSWDPAPRFENAFRDVKIPVPRTFEDKLAGRPEALRRAEMAIADMPDFRERGVPATLPFEERKRRNLQALVKNYYRVLLSVDENLGRVLDYMDKSGLAENTVVVYTSDNGFFLGEHGLYDKRLMYEPSVRVPMLVRYPGRVKPATVDRRMVLNIDIAPSLLEWAGVPVPVHMQGRSWAPLFQQPGASWRDAFLYEYYEYPAVHCVRKNRGVRTDQWKLIHYWEQPQEWELYDVKTDPDELTNLAAQPEYADQLARLKATMNQLRGQLRDYDPPGPPPVALPCRQGA
ncbi:MAG: sulfatase [Acidobacteria bacterium]|nr:sulfatase [Acidobacteriota bacterium]